MKRLIIICAFFIPFMMNAQSKDEQLMTARVEQLRMAMINGDRTALENLVAEKLSYGHSSGQIDDKNKFIEKLVSGASDFVSIVLTEQTVSISEKVAIVRHILTAKTNDGGKPGDVHIRVLLIWQKQKGDWKLLARQAVKI
jgi:ketosteroid isomerase-like protein